MAKGKDGMKAYASKRNKDTSATRVTSVPVGQRKSAEITKAENGYIVSQYISGTCDKPGYDRKIVCKTIEEAQAKAASLLKM